MADTTMPPGVRKFLDASTHHITKRDSNILESWALEDRNLDPQSTSPPYRTISHGHGWWVHVRHEPEVKRERYEAEALLSHGISLDFMVLQDYARKHGCWWINLDSDADEIPGLPTHDW